MRSTIGAALVALALGALHPAAAGQARTVEAPYEFDLTQPGVSGWFGTNYGIFFGETVTIDTLRKERTVSLTVTDDAGNDVSAAAWQEGAESVVFCNESGPLAISGGRPLFVQVIVDATPHEPGGCATPTVPTTGTATAVFRR